jgi:hypothetical protein
MRTRFALALLGTVAGAAVAGPAATMEHRVRVDHASGATDVRYRGDVAIAHRQVGSVAPGGRQSTLGCRWSASVTVTREARHASGTRTIAAPRAIEGTRAGWCGTHRDAIAQEVAQRTDSMREHLLATARDDHGVLVAEIERLHGSTRAG